MRENRTRSGPVDFEKSACYNIFRTYISYVVQFKKFLGSDNLAKVPFSLRAIFAIYPSTFTIPV